MRNNIWAYLFIDWEDSILDKIVDCAFVLAERSVDIAGFGNDDKQHEEDAGTLTM